MSEMELKPCPKCDRTLFVNVICFHLDDMKHHMGHRWGVYCSDPECAICVTGHTENEAVRKWNRRPTEDALRAELDKAMAMIGEKYIVNMDLEITNKNLQLENDRLQKRVTELEDKNGSILAWADACEKHGFRNQEELNAVCELNVEQEEAITRLQRRVRELEGALKEKCWECKADTQPPPLVCKHCKVGKVLTPPAKEDGDE